MTEANTEFYTVCIETREKNCRIFEYQKSCTCTSHADMIDTVQKIQDGRIMSQWAQGAEEVNIYVKDIRGQVVLGCCYQFMENPPLKEALGE